jgi:hypothetical protein
MRVESTLVGNTFHYRLFPDAGDPVEGRRDFADHPAPFTRVRDEYQVEVPLSFTSIHPDVHAVAIWYALRPFIGSRLELPFGVSSQLANSMIREYGVELTPVDPACSPRRPPAQDRPILLFSGGMDSMAASLVLPSSTRSVFLDRIVHASQVSDGDALIDLARQRDACDALRADGQDVHATLDDHEWLMEPYPMWHSDMPILSVLYLADSLGMAVFDTGEVLDAVHIGGYQGAEPTSWRFGQSSRGPQTDDASAKLSRGADRAYLSFVGISRAQSISGLSEVATAAIVARSHRRGKSFSCYYRSDASFCMRCDKCMKKVLLSHIARGESVPAALIDQFLSSEHPRAVFRRRFLDWHHVWYYLFQKIECEHWFVKELHEQALRGPDLGMLEKWYPPSRGDIVEFYRDEVVARIAERVPTMSAAEIEALERMDVPPLEIPDLARYEAARGSRAKPPTPLAPQAGAASANRSVAKLADFLQGEILGTPLAGYGIVRTSLHDLDGWVHVELAPGASVAARHHAAAGPFTLILMPGLDVSTPAFQRAGTIGVCYLGTTPVDTRSKLDAVLALCRRLEEFERANAT